MVGKYWPRPNLEARTLVAAPRKEYYVINTVVRNNRVQLSRPAIRQTKKTQVGCRADQVVRRY
jgi:hypothetical protein